MERSEIWSGGRGKNDREGSLCERTNNSYVKDDTLMYEPCSLAASGL